MIRPVLVLSLSSLALAACAGPRQAGHESAPVARAALKSADGTSAGEVTLRRSGDALTLRLEANGLATGPHGTHLHMTGLCEAPGFTSAGGHLNPGGHQHGALNAQGSHLGDLPNLVIGADGSGSLNVTLPGPADTVMAQIFDADGAAVVIHASPDDQQTDPSGNSGARIACGVMTRTP